MSILKVSTIQNLSGTEVYLAKVWVNFNGTGTVAIRASGNTSSITDSGVGAYSVNYTVAQIDANYSYAHTCTNEVNAQHTQAWIGTGGQTTVSCALAHFNAANSVNTTDKAWVLVSLYR